MQTFISIFVFCALVLVFRSHALKCKSDGGPKEEELRSVYMDCVKKQDGDNSSDISSKGSWSGERRSNQEQENRWDRTRTQGNNMRNRDDGMSRNDDYDREMPNYNSYYNNMRSSTPLPRRFRRERRMEMNSGQRSQYNPNTSHKSSGNEDKFRRNERNSSKNMTGDDGTATACVLHCFLEDLDMTGDDGMPDRYLVTNVLTKNVKNEDLKEFLQESVEECFQILSNEKTEDKCEFSKTLMMCLSEKGSANCDDWKEDMKF